MIDGIIRHCSMYQVQLECTIVSDPMSVIINGDKYLALIDNSELH